MSELWHAVRSILLHSDHISSDSSIGSACNSTVFRNEPAAVQLILAAINHNGSAEEICIDMLLYSVSSNRLDSYNIIHEECINITNITQSSKQKFLDYFKPEDKPIAEVILKLIFDRSAGDGFGESLVINVGPEK
ncbi:Protein of unknown function [Pyronema omphalodes CBS 100304]|uniref:Uncharacterized protein n=1 Tax=Pyronema omphalodes (strain CBS 100304) TaxID=1076935 RepID=U4LIU6_PYROM|nr:Protein of unknown function [Pyronema omphalodes CBS 100304]